MLFTDSPFGDVVLILCEISRQTEVADFDQLSLTDQDVPSSQISVETLEDLLSHPHRLH